jgi:hypothetical protein
VIATLTVLPFTDYDCDLHPQKIDTTQKARMTIRNRGNHPETFVLTLKDKEDKLDFSPPQVKLEVPEGQRGAIDFSARSKQFQLFRKPVSHAYSAELGTASGEAKRTFSGEIVSNGLIPTWLFPLLLVACLGLAALSALGVGLAIKSHQPTPTPSAVPVETQASPFAVLPAATTEAAPTTDLTQLAVTPSATPTPEIICGIKSQYFKKGDKVVVVADVGLNVYNQPNDSIRVGVIPFNSILVILDEKPVCVTIKDTGAKYLRWNVSYGDGSQGWVSEVEGTFLIRPKK